MRRIALGLSIAMAALGAPLAAQQEDREARVPREYAPPRGMCRVWLAGVPASKQPAPTDCAAAIRKRPADGRVIFGPSEEDRHPPAREFPQLQSDPRRRATEAEDRRERAERPDSRPSPEAAPARKADPPAQPPPRRTPRSPDAR